MPLFLKLAIMIYTIVRSGAPILAVYKSSEIPGFSVWTLPKMALWMISLDYWFYVHLSILVCSQQTQL
jgi:hypothetical protein